MFSVPMPCTPVLFPNFTPTSFPLFWQGRSTDLAPNFYCNSAFSTWSSRLQGLGDEDVIGWMNLRCWNVLRNLTFQLRMMMHGCLLKQWLPSWRNTSPIVFCWWKGTKDFQNPTVNLCRFPSSTHHQTKKQGKDPHFGMDKSMFKLQGILWTSKTTSLGLTVAFLFSRSTHKQVSGPEDHGSCLAGKCFTLHYLGERMGDLVTLL